MNQRLQIRMRSLFFRLSQGAKLIKISIQQEELDITTEIQIMRSRSVGAISTFFGTVRDSSKDSSLVSLTLEHYPGMSEKALNEIARKAKKKWLLEYATIIHRVGRLKPEEMIVFVGCASAHRHDAFDGCRYIMDFLKTDAPFWKAEETKEGLFWVSERGTDKRAAENWLLEEQIERG